MNIFENLYRNQKGQSIIEVGLIISLVVVVAVTALKLFGYGVEDLFNLIGTKTSEVL